MMMVAREKSGPDLARNKNKAKLSSARDQKNTMDRTWNRPETILIGL